MTATALANADMPQAAWIRDGERWAILVPPHMAKAGERVLVARADGTHVREVRIGGVTARCWRDKIVCTVGQTQGKGFDDDQ